MRDEGSGGNADTRKRRFNPKALLDLIKRQRRIPSSTYRLQFHRNLTFQGAAAVIPYLARLGIDSCYLSPYLQARPGTQHGYDICDHSKLHAELGSELDYIRLNDELAAHDMGQIVDFVPNHMGLDPTANPWWRDVLENGPASAFAGYFDIDWDPVKPELKGKVLLPFLDDQYGVVLERGDLTLAWKAGRLVVQLQTWDLPVDPKTFPIVLEPRLALLIRKMGAHGRAVKELRNVLQALRNLPERAEVERSEERRLSQAALCSKLSDLVNGFPELTEHVQAAVARINGNPGQRKSFDRLHQLLEAQAYRLAHWKTAHDEINYRRFFEINELGGLRMEEPAVFRATHAFLLRLIREGRVSGVRIDHLDGLFDPPGYLERLQEAVMMEWASLQAGSENWNDEDLRKRIIHWRRRQKAKDPGGLATRPIYLLAEKILVEGESLPLDWPLHGTSGYDFLNQLNGIFIDSSTRLEMEQTYVSFSGRLQDFSREVYECKKLITWMSVASELKILARELNRISESDRTTRDFTIDALREALREVVASFPVYRTYLDGSPVSARDRQIIEKAVALAKRRSSMMEPTVIDFLRSVLLERPDFLVNPDEARRRLAFVRRFQQYTSPVEAKGVEDTAFYRFNLLLSLNEVGGNPKRFGTPLLEFHAVNLARQRQWPGTMLATATHDTKRGEDVRARLNVLTEVPTEWRRSVFRWAEINSIHRSDLGDTRAPDANDEYLLYQTLVGVWPPQDLMDPDRPVGAEFIERVRAFFLKAVKEAKRNTSWIFPDEQYDEAAVRFVTGVLSSTTTSTFLGEFLPFARRVAELGMVNSLAQVVVKAISPGVADFYQGTELWDLSLVDPDNRRPVDFNLRQAMLSELEPYLLPQEESTSRSEKVEELLRSWPDGRIKLFVTAASLRLRRRVPELFLSGRYHPLTPVGRHASSVIGVARSWENRWVLAVVPRCFAGLSMPDRFLPVGKEAWGETELILPEGSGLKGLYNLFTGERVVAHLGERGNTIPIGEVLSRCPIALLVGDATL